MNPALMIRRQAAGRHDAMHVWMADQRLPPRVKNAEDPDLGAQMSGIGRKLAERRRTRLEKPGVQAGTIPIGERQERMRQRKDDMHIGHVEEITLAGVQPALPRLRLALRAVAIPTRV